MRAVTTTAAPCVHCDARDDELLWTAREHEYDTTDAEFRFVRCRGCGVVRLDPRPDVSELGTIYPPDYYAFNLVSHEDGRLRLTDRLKQRVYQRRIEELVGRLGHDGPVRLLDVGCGDGRLLNWYRASAVGHRLETFGIEMDAGAADAARAHGHQVITGRFEVDTELPADGFDLVLAFHVIEHVDDPVAFARRGAEVLAPGGRFVLSTPNWDSRDARRLRRHWGGNHTPRHWTLYDEGTLGDLARSVGLGVARVDYEPNPIFWVWSCHSWLRERFPGSRWPDRLFPPVRIFDPGPRTLLLMGLFSGVEAIQRRATGRTASMVAELQG